MKAQEEIVNAITSKKSVTFTALKPELIVEAQKLGEAVTFYKSAFGAVEVEQSLYYKRKLDHRELPHVISAELKLAGTTIVVSEISSYSGSVEKLRLIFRLETDNVDAAVGKAVLAGAVKLVDEVEIKGGGIREIVTDPFGFTWSFSNPAKIDNAEQLLGDGDIDRLKLLEDGDINGLRDMVIDRIEHFREFSKKIIGHAIDGFIHRGPRFVMVANDIQDFIRFLSEMASLMCQWIRSLIEAVDEEVDEAVPEAVDEVVLGAVPEAVDHEVVPSEAVPNFYISRIRRRHFAHRRGQIGFDAFFTTILDLAKKILNDVERYAKDMVLLCPTLETVGELHVLDEVISECIEFCERIDDTQQVLENQEDRIAGDVDSGNE